MVEQLAGVGALLAGLGWFGFGIAAVVREYFAGTAKLIRARRGDPELPALPTFLPRFQITR